MYAKHVIFSKLATYRWRPATLLEKRWGGGGGGGQRHLVENFPKV